MRADLNAGLGNSIVLRLIRAGGVNDDVGIQSSQGGLETRHSLIEARGFDHCRRVFASQTAYKFFSAIPVAARDKQFAIRLAK